MKFLWDQYEEISTCRVNTLQIFITNKCNLRCKGCFARHAMGEDRVDMNVGEYERAIWSFVEKGGQKINLLGGEPFLHPNLLKFININNYYGLKTTIYTNGYFLNKYSQEEMQGAKLRVSIYSFFDGDKAICKLPDTKTKFDANFMVSRTTTIKDLLRTAELSEFMYGCNVFFISSLRELDNPRQEFFDDTDLTMPVMEYKELVHKFLKLYYGKMEIHVSKRGVFESTHSCGFNKCRFANYFIGGKIIQCPYNVVNLKYQDDYEFNKKYCQQNSSCLMTKVIYKRKI